MAGTIYGLGLSQQWDSNGDPISGGKLYIYEAGTTTPVDAFEDFGLTGGNEHAHPMLTDSAGRIPSFWLADGFYHVVFTTAADVVVFDEDDLAAIGPVESGGGEGEVDETSIFATGDMLWRPTAGTRSGWVRANGRTIGSAASGATERANADTGDLYEFFWDNFSDALCPVAGGRGATAGADFAADKALGTLDMRGRAPFGLDDMGNSTAGVLVAGTPTAAASTVGAETVTIAQANLPNVNLVSTSLTGVVADLSIANGTSVVRLNSGGFANVDTAGDDQAEGMDDPASATLTLNSGIVTIGGNVPLGGSGTATNKMPPGRLGTWFCKL